MKQNFTHYFKSIILAIAFLLSGAIPTFGQELLIYDSSAQYLGTVNPGQTVQISGSNPFYFAINVQPLNIYYISSTSSDAVKITTTAYTNNSLRSFVNWGNNEEEIGNVMLQDHNPQMFQISDNEGSRKLCWKYENSTLSIAIHEISEVAETQNATCTEDGYVTYRCRLCGETRTEILNSTGHSFGEWQTMEGGRFRTCSHDEENHIQYDMDATGVNALEITLTDGTKLSYPQTLNPVVSFSDLDLSISFDTDKTSTVSKADIKEYNQVWSHNKKGYAQNEDKTYSHACDVADCTFKYNDLFVKNAGQYYAAENKDGVIKVADMTLNDSEGYDCEADITVGSVSYSRDMKDNQWGTLCLPFAINPNAYSDCSFYQLNDVDETNSTIVLKQIDDEIIPAGVPVLVRCNDAVADIAIAAENVPMSNSTQAGVTTGNFTLVGTLTTSDALGDDCYVISNDKFQNVPDIVANGEETTVTVSAFRAYLEAATPTAKIWNIAINNGTPTVIDVLNVIESGEMEIYDLSGRRLPDLQKGVNIVRQGNQTTKIFIK